MTNLKHEIETIKFAMENGFTNIGIAPYGNEEVAFTGSFGTLVVKAEEAKILIDLVAEITMPKKETTETNETTWLKEGMVFTRGRMVRTIKRFDHENFPFPAIIYSVKDGSERFVSFESFENFAKKKGTNRVK